MRKAWLAARAVARMGLEFWLGKLKIEFAARARDTRRKDPR